MAVHRETILYTEEDSSVVVKLKVKEGSSLNVGKILLVFEYEEPVQEKERQRNGHNKQHYIRANSDGLVTKVLIKEGDILTKK